MGQTFKKIRKVTVFCFFCVAFLQAARQGYAKEGHVIAPPSEKKRTIQSDYAKMMAVFEEKKWDKLLEISRGILREYPGAAFTQDAQYYLAVAYFYLEDYEIANKEFSRYLKRYTSPKFFEKAIEYKFLIAEKFKSGAKKHLLGVERLPQLVPAKEGALEIYDEVIAALPHHDLAAKALFAKARMQLDEEDYKGAIEAYQTLIRRFPKHSLSPESYVGIGGVFLTQARLEYPDPAFLELAELNLRKFKKDFSRDERIQVNEYMLKEMHEIYANHLYDTGRFFERTNKPSAAKIYYSKILAKYPATRASKQAQKRLVDVEQSLKRLEAEKRPLSKSEKATAQHSAPQEKVEVQEEASILEQEQKDVLQQEQTLTTSNPQIEDRREPSAVEEVVKDKCTENASAGEN